MQPPPRSNRPNNMYQNGPDQGSQHPLNDHTEKLQKVLARAGLASRRTIEDWILDGRVSVNGVLAKVGDRVSDKDQIRVDGRVIKVKSEEESTRRVILYYKPDGEVCTRTDPQGRPTVFDRLPRLVDERWVAVGRLDINTQGLILFTNDGDLANRLMHPSSQIEREYAVRILGELTKEQMDALRSGVTLEDGVASFTGLKYGGGREEGANHWYHAVISEGKKREVRRMFESQGVQVSRLIRVRYAHLQLPKGLAQGRWIELDRSDIDKLSKSVGVKLKKRTGLYGRKKVRADKTEEKMAGKRRGYLRRKK